MEQTKHKIRHPAKYTDAFLEYFAEMLQGTSSVLDPFAGTGKIGMIKNYGYRGKIYANEIEREWLMPNEYGCDVLTFDDAETLSYAPGWFDAICTSPTYGNRMADHHVAKDGSKRNTYTHCLGRPLAAENTGKMQWGEEYRNKHMRIYARLNELVKPNGIFVLNIKNHIRKGQEIDVVSFHVNALEKSGFAMCEKKYIHTPSLKYGANSTARLDGEYIIKFIKNAKEAGA